MPFPFIKLTVIFTNCFPFLVAVSLAQAFSGRVFAVPHSSQHNHR